MIKVFGVGRGKSVNSSSSIGNTTQETNKVHPGQIRMQTELSELELPTHCKIDFPDVKNLMNF